MAERNTEIEKLHEKRGLMLIQFCDLWDEATELQCEGRYHEGLCCWLYKAKNTFPLPSTGSDTMAECSAKKSSHVSEIEKLRAAMEAVRIDNKTFALTPAELLTAAEAWALRHGFGKGQDRFYKSEHARLTRHTWWNTRQHLPSVPIPRVADAEGLDDDSIDIIAVTQALEWWKKEEK